MKSASTPLKNIWLKTAFCLAALGYAGSAHAQDTWPERAVTLVIPYSAGGPTDVVARLLAIPMAKSLGQTIIVENMVGAGGTIAPARVAKAKANGYTILLHHMGMATAPALYKTLTYDPLKDFEYIDQVVDVPMTLLSRKNFHANNFQELLDYVKTHK
jgi:tripartite-type tricarboxylate transporter receptor subunit TctC